MIRKKSSIKKNKLREVVCQCFSNRLSNKSNLMMIVTTTLMNLKNQIHRATKINKRIKMMKLLQQTLNDKWIIDKWIKWFKHRLESRYKNSLKLRTNKWRKD